MNAADDRLMSIFSAALDFQSEADQTAYLSQVCRDEPGLRARVQALLLAHAGAGQFLESHEEKFCRQISPELVTTEAPSPAPGVGTVVAARYKVLEPIGEGGMGTVWLAQQTEPVRRKVALKLIKPGMDTKEVVARFSAERQALALMDHPNISKVLDGGVTDQGRPFFVMELVRGTPITEYCDRARLAVRDRLGLFVQVCQAVQHAHQKGVIHRDVKPSNVLVTEQDGKPVAKVIDFGVAKAVGQQLTANTVYTRLMQLVGTPLYMSPEQAQLSAVDVDTRADIYSLGVILYELLIGTTPFDQERLKTAGHDEIRRIIREEEPIRPSTRLSTLGQAAETVSSKRGSDARKLSALCRGELDWIVMKSLEKDRNRRYETVSALAQDVQRYLNDEPVLACPPSFGYRLGKFLRRNKGPVLAAALVLLALVSGAIGLVFGLMWRHAEQARKLSIDAQHGETRAKLEAEEARERLAAVEYGRAMQIAHQEWWDNNVAATLALLESTRADLRGWEWNYVNRLGHAELVAFREHTDTVNSPSFSPDGSKIVTASHDHTARVWNTSTGTEILKIPHPDAVISASFSSDGSLLLTGCVDHVARIWDARTGAEVEKLPHPDAVISASFSPDRERVATASHDRITRVWDVRTKTVVLTLKHTQPVSSVLFSPDGSKLVTACGDQTAQVWDAKTGVEVLTLRGHTGSVRSASFSPDGARLLTGSLDRTARVWDAKTGTETLTLRHTDAVLSASFSPDGLRLVTATHDRTARVWDAKTGVEILVLRGHTGSVKAAAFSPDGSRLVTASVDRTARVWNAKTGAEGLTLEGHTGQVWPASFSRDGSRLITAGVDGTARLWDVKTRAEVLKLKHTHAVYGSSFSPAGSRVVTASHDNLARVWDARTGNEILVLRGHTGSVRSATFSPDGSKVVTASHDRTARVWDARTGAELLMLNHTDTVQSASFSPDGSRLVTTGSDRIARVWDVHTGAEVVAFRGHTAAVLSVSFSRDGSRIVTGSFDRTARVWDAKTGAELLILQGHGGPIWSASFSPDDLRVATAGSIDRTVRLWDARTGVAVLTLKHTDTVQSATFSPDGLRLVTSAGATVRIWDGTPLPKAEGVSAAPAADGP